MRWLLLVSCIFFVACDGLQPRTGQSSQRILIDDLGHRVKITPHPQRIVSLAPSITEILFALEVQSQVVGVTSFCDYPAAAKNKVQVGDTIKPDLERIIALQPDLVLISTASQLEKLTQDLNQFGIPVFVTNPKTLAEVFDSIRKIGTAVDAPQAADALVNGLQQRLAKVEVPSTRPRLLYVLQLSPLITVGKNTYINDVLASAGAESISATETTDYPQFSLEAVIARQPEVILLPKSHGTELIAIEEVRRRFSMTPAVKNNRLIQIDPDIIDRPGPRLVAGIETLAAALQAK